MIKAGEIAFLKTTGEAVFVINITDPSPKIGDKSFTVTVRRPVYAQTGNTHEVEEFTLPELESLDEQRKRVRLDQMMLMEKYGPKADDLPPTTDTGFSDN